VGPSQAVSATSRQTAEASTAVLLLIFALLRFGKRKTGTDTTNSKTKKLQKSSNLRRFSRLKIAVFKEHTFLS
jgi:hypothetical protein